MSRKLPGCLRMILTQIMILAVFHGKVQAIRALPGAEQEIAGMPKSLRKACQVLEEPAVRLYGGLADAQLQQEVHGLCPHRRLPLFESQGSMVWTPRRRVDIVENLNSTASSSQSS